MSQPAVQLHLYHGSPERKDRPPYGADGNQQVEIVDGAPFFATDDIGYAAHFARGGLVATLCVTFERLADLREEGLQEELLEVYNASEDGPWDEMLWGEVQESPYALLESPAVTAYLREQGYDGVVMAEDYEYDVTSWAILDSSRVRLIEVAPASAFEGECARFEMGY